MQLKITSFRLDMPLRLAIPDVPIWFSFSFQGFFSIIGFSRAFYLIFSRAFQQWSSLPVFSIREIRSAESEFLIYEVINL